MPSVLAQLSILFADLLQQPGLVLTAQMQTGDLDGWDSFKNVEILMACEERWHIRFSSREIDRIRTVGDLTACIEAKGGS
ncbi:MAG: acyl carrier protein [Telluria sp.]